MQGVLTLIKIGNIAVHILHDKSGGSVHFRRISAACIGLGADSNAIVGGDKHRVTRAFAIFVDKLNFDIALEGVISDYKCTI